MHVAVHHLLVRRFANVDDDIISRRGILCINDLSACDEHLRQRRQFIHTGVKIPGEVSERDDEEMPPSDRERIPPGIPPGIAMKDMLFGRRTERAGDLIHVQSPHG